MKRFAVCLLVVAFLTMGCLVPTLISLKADRDIKGNIAILLAAVKKCPINNEGWQILEIPNKDPESKFPIFHVFLNPKDGIWGVGIQWNENIGQMLAYSPDSGWSFEGIPLDEAKAMELLQGWIERAIENGDLEKARTFVRMAPGTAI